MEVKKKKPLGFELSSYMHMNYAYDNHIYLFFLIYNHICIPFLTDIFLVLIMPITFEIVHICISIQNTHAHEVLGDSHKYFTFVSHICSSTPMIP